MYHCAYCDLAAISLLGILVIYDTSDDCLVVLVFVMCSCQLCVLHSGSASIVTRKAKSIRLVLNFKYNMKLLSRHSNL